MRLTKHIQQKAAELGIPMCKIEAVLEHPDRIAHSTIHPGQLRYTGNGIAVMVQGGCAITVYLDTVLTPLRPDQIEAGVIIKRKG